MPGMTECLRFLGPSVIVPPAVAEDQREILCQSSEVKKHRRTIPELFLFAVSFTHDRDGQSEGGQPNWNPANSYPSSLIPSLSRHPPHSFAVQPAGFPGCSFLQAAETESRFQPFDLQQPQQRRRRAAPRPFSAFFKPPHTHTVCILHCRRLSQ